MVRKKKFLKVINMYPFYYCVLQYSAFFSVSFEVFILFYLAGFSPLLSCKQKRQFGLSNFFNEESKFSKVIETLDLEI